jgi:hypothetical protein
MILCLYRMIGAGDDHEAGRMDSHPACASWSLIMAEDQEWVVVLVDMVAGLDLLGNNPWHLVGFGTVVGLTQEEIKKKKSST